MLRLGVGGNLEDRLFFARLVQDPNDRDDQLKSIALDQVTEENYEDALAITDSMQSEILRDIVWMEIAKSYAWAGDVASALSLAQQIQHQTTRDETLHTIVLAQLDSTDFEGASASAALMAETSAKANTIRLIEERAWRHKVLKRDEN